MNYIDSAKLSRQHEWSLKTFGPGARTAGVIDHIKKELVEVAESPEDVSEWADLVILAFDGALRAGHEPQEIIDAIIDKQAVNEGREWPDWRLFTQDQAIQHVKNSHRCDTYNHRYIPATTMGIYDDGTGEAQETFYCQPCTEIMVDVGEYKVTRRIG